MRNDYLNPVELLELTDRPALTGADVRKAKKRFLTEMQLDGRDDFDYHGRLYTRNDLDRTTAECEDPSWLEAYIAAANAPGLSAFLVNGEATAELDSQQLFNPRLKPILDTYFAPVFNQSFGRAVASGDDVTAQLLTAWNPERAGLREGDLYRDAYQTIDNRAAIIQETIEAFVRNPNQPKAQSIHGLKVFDEHLPTDLLDSLPPYFGDLFERMIDRVIPSVANINNQRQRPRVALNITRRLYQLPHLSEQRRADLKEIGQKLKANADTVRANARATASAGGGDDGVSAGRIIWMIIVGIIILFRIGACVERSNRYSNNNYRYDNYRSNNSYRPSSSTSYRSAPVPPPPPPPPAAPPKNKREQFIDNLRTAASAGFALGDVQPHSAAGIDPKDIAIIYRDGAGIVEANVALARLGEDTIFHVRGNVFPEPKGTSFSPGEIFRQYEGRSPRPGEAKTNPFYADLLALQEEVESGRFQERRQRERAKRNARTSAKQPAKGETKNLGRVLARTAAEPKPAPARIRPRTSFARSQKDDLLGSRAGLPANYYLYQKKFEEDDGRLMSIKAATDDPEVSAIVVWRDTLGVRQMRVPGNVTAPFVFDVGRGKVDKLTEAYVVYGRGWSKSQRSPWGGKSWFREVIGYFGPEDHGAFVNGKKSFRKNLWLPTKKADPAKSMTPAKWLAGIKRLR